jgi:hypothetical protein
MSLRSQLTEGEVRALLQKGAVSEQPGFLFKPIPGTPKRWGQRPVQLVNLKSLNQFLHAASIPLRLEACVQLS